MKLLSVAVSQSWTDVRERQPTRWTARRYGLPAGERNDAAPQWSVCSTLPDATRCAATHCTSHHHDPFPTTQGAQTHIYGAHRHDLSAATNGFENRPNTTLWRAI
ncbi:hypothetical protein GCM10018780_82330 [Streptomyces lanatus]|nr:hypothetical protein GCM10018780_82330 [Streptomyces lanatus]